MWFSWVSESRPEIYPKALEELTSLRHERLDLDSDAASYPVEIPTAGSSPEWKLENLKQLVGFVGEEPT
jgi:hypothetical protein